MNLLKKKKTMENRLTHSQYKVKKKKVILYAIQYWFYNSTHTQMEREGREY